MGEHMRPHRLPSSLTASQTVVRPCVSHAMRRRTNAVISRIDDQPVTWTHMLSRRRSSTRLACENRFFAKSEYYIDYIRRDLHVVQIVPWNATSQSPGQL